MRNVLLLGLGLVAALIVVYLLVVLDPVNGLIFSAEKFSDKFLDFVIGLLSMLATFTLLNLFWEERQKLARRSAVRRRLFLGLSQLYKHTDEALQLIELALSVDEASAIQEKEVRVLRIFRQLKSMCSGLAHFGYETEIADDMQLSTTIDIMWEKIVPLVDSLIERSSIYPDLDDVQDTLRILLDAIEDALMELNNGIPLHNIFDPAALSKEQT